MFERIRACSPFRFVIFIIVPVLTAIYVATSFTDVNMSTKPSMQNMNGGF